MPRKLSEIHYDFDRTLARLERAQDRLTRATQEGRQAVSIASKEHLAAADTIFEWLRTHPGKTIIASTKCYHLDHGQVVQTEPVWGHETWVEDPAPPPAEPQADPMTLSPGRDAELTAMATAWGTIDPRAGEAEVEAGEGWEEPNGQPVAICPD